jgi:hypothetical protein
MLRIFLAFILIIKISDIVASDLGVVGLFDTPTARMLKDGGLKISYSTQKIANITNITYQATPWLETTFRYSVFNPDNPNRNSFILDGLNDRSYAAKIRIKEETKYVPELSFGIQDILGTGAWNGEYLVASKNLNNFDISIGMGWGRLSERAVFSNPIGLLSDKFKERELENKSNGGRIRSNTFLKGRDVGLFGGISYKFTNTNLKFLIEYNSDAYEREIRLGTIKSSSPISIGLEWSPFDGSSLTLSHQQGNQFGISLSSLIDTKYLPQKKKLKSFYSSYDGYSISSFPMDLNFNSWYDRLFYDLDKSGILLRGAKVFPEYDQINIEITNYRYNLTADAINRVLSLSHIHLPKNIKNINVIINEGGFRVLTIAYKRINHRNKYEKVNNKNLLTVLPPRGLDNPNYKTNIRNSFNTDINISTRFQLFDPDKPVKHQFFLKIATLYNISNNWNLVGSFSIDLYNNFDLNRGPSSSLPHVRTEINQYLVNGSSGIDSFYLEGKYTIKNNIYIRAYVGLLEMMYSGFGGEVLYQPFKSRFALGATINKVKKRGYERNFELLDYETVTGFLSLYYASPFYNYDIGLHMGRYLAKDKGVTVEVRRTFDSGFSIGAFATSTNVSSSDFGEGSFDKGLFFSIPFNSFAFNDTKSAFTTIVRSLQRDGGQKLDDFTGRLWHDIRNVRYDRLENNKNRMMLNE